MELIKIGKALKTHGFKGHLRIFIDEFYMDDFKAMKAIFIEQLPYFILAKDINSESQAIISLEDINSKERAFLLQGKDIYAKEEELSEILEEDPYKELIGYTMEDQQIGKIGEIVEILEMPQQYIAQILKEGKEILVPLNDTFIQKIDDRKKIVFTQLPEGLLDIF